MRPISHLPPPVAVERVELHRVRVALRCPHVAAHGTETHRELVLVEVVGRDGVRGWGECDTLTAPTYTGEWTDGAWLVLRDHLVPGWLRGGAGVRGHPMASAAVEGAAIDLRLRREGRSLADELGSGRSRLEWGAVLSGAADVDTLLVMVAAALEAGATLVKVKIDPQWSSEPLAAVRGAWPDLTLSADANGSFAGDPGEVESLDVFGLAYIEQPLAPTDLVGHARLARRVGTPIALDESLVDAGATEAALAIGSLAVANVKPARVGGIAEARAMLDLVGSVGAIAFVGGMLELGVGRAIAAAVATHPAASLPTDLGPSTRYVSEDLTPAVEVDEDGRLVVPDGPGIGLEPDRDRLSAATIDRVIVAAPR